MARFRDATGRTGASTWEFGSYPDGQADYPGGHQLVRSGGVRQVCRQEPADALSLVSRVGHRRDLLRHPAVEQLRRQGHGKAGERAGLGPWGTLDMAGNVQGVGAPTRSPIGPCATSSAAAGTSRATASPSRTPRIRGRGRAAWRAAGQEPRTCGHCSVPSAGSRPIQRRRPRHRRGSTSIGASTTTTRLRWRRGSMPSTTARRTGGKRRSVSPPRTARNDYRPSCSCRRTRSRLPDHRLVSVRVRGAVPSSGSLDLGTSNSSSAAGAPCSIRSTRGRSSGATASAGSQRGPRPARAVGEGFSPRGGLSRDAAGGRHAAAGLLQPEHGRVLRTDPVALEPRVKVAVFVSGGLRYNCRRRCSRRTSRRA